MTSSSLGYWFAAKIFYVGEQMIEQGTDQPVQSQSRTANKDWMKLGVHLILLAFSQLPQQFGILLSIDGVASFFYAKGIVFIN